MSHDILRRLERSLRTAGAQGREVVPAGSFRIFISQDPSYYLSFAVPLEPEPQDWQGSIEALKGAFAARERRPRLEFFKELHPSLAAALETTGFRRESAAPVMVLTPQGLAPAPAVAKGDYLRLGSEQRRLKDFLLRQNLAYGMPDDAALSWLPQLTTGLEGGTVMAAALEQEGELVAGASVQIGGEAGELAGVWTLPAKQKQGLAFELCQRLLADYFAAGYDLLWLSAAEGAKRLYEKLGFIGVGTQLNYGLS